jgi:hypothetical protein
MSSSSAQVQFFAVLAAVLSCLVTHDAKWMVLPVAAASLRHRIFTRPFSSVEIPLFSISYLLAIVPLCLALAGVTNETSTIAAAAAIQAHGLLWEKTVHMK